MHLLITGGAGYIGSRVVAHLLARGHAVTVFDSLIYGGEALLPLISFPAFNLINGDVRKTSDLEVAAKGVDAIIHLAAIVGEAACELDATAALEVNHGAVAGVLDVAASCGVTRFVLVSTCSNYGVSGSDTLASEDSEMRPLSLYARTKVDAEKTTLGYRGPTTPTVLRLGTVCGLSARMRFDLLVNEMARSAALGHKIEIYKPHAWRPFLHIADAGRVVDHILSQPLDRVANRVFNVVGQNFTKHGLVDLVLKYFPHANVSITEGQPDQRDYRVSSERIERELGFLANHTVEEAMVEVSDAVRNGLFVDPLWPGHSAVPLSRRALASA